MKPTFVFLILIAGILPLAAKSPNFVFFLVDDLGWGDLGCYGSKFHETPNLDKLAAEGMRFTNGYSACTVCSPSRAAILTGRYPGRLHLTDWIAGHRRQNPKLLIPDWNKKMDHSLVTLPEALREGGYQTQFIGKWHLMPIGGTDFKEHFPESHGFDSNIAGREWGQPKGPGKYFAPFGMPNLPDGEKGDFLTDALTDEAIKFVDKAVAREDPFFLYFCYYTVHGPIMAKPHLVQKYKAKAQQFEGSNENLNPAYAGMIESLDDSVGRLIERLRKHGVEGDTVVIFTADNGGVSEKSSGGLRGRKALSYEGGTREPVIVKWPGKVRPGSLSAAPMIGTDFYPTLLSMAGLPLRPEAHVDGVDLTNILKGDTQCTGRDSLYWHYPHYHSTKPYGAIRKGNWKLIEFFEDDSLELYNLLEDPAESKNLVGSDPEKLGELHRDLVAWRESVGAQMPTPNPHYDPNYVAPRKRPRRQDVTKPVGSKFGKVSASSAQNGNPPEAALDGSRSTRWAASGDSVPQWWQLEFGETRELAGVEIHWRNPTWYSHQVEVSQDGKKWQVVADQKGSQQSPAAQEHKFETQAKYLRVVVDDLGSGWVTFTELVPLFR